MAVKSFHGTRGRPGGSGRSGAASACVSGSRTMELALPLNITSGFSRYSRDFMALRSSKARASVLLPSGRAWSAWGVSSVSNPNSAKAVVSGSNWQGSNDVAPADREVILLVEDDPNDQILMCRSFRRSEEHTSELQSLMRSSYAVS